MGRKLLIPGTLAAALSVVPQSASAATLALDRGCYLARQPGFVGQRVNLTGAGFNAGSVVAFQLAGSPLGTATADPTGGVTGAFNAPSVPGGAFKSTPTLLASDGTNQATIPLPLTRLAADFLPSRGNPRTLRVRFYVYGFGPLLTVLGRSTSQPVYEHVLRPNGRRKATFYVGRTGGPCGELRTARRRILPFRLENGTWRFVFTTSPRYSRRSAPLASVGFVVRTVFGPAP
jgi:hypothetical protein